MSFVAEACLDYEDYSILLLHSIGAAHVRTNPTSKIMSCTFV